MYATLISALLSLLGMVALALFLVMLREFERFNTFCFRLFGVLSLILPFVSITCLIFRSIHPDMPRLIDAIHSLYLSGGSVICAIIFCYCAVLKHYPKSS